MNMEELLKLVVCPACHGDLVFTQTGASSGLACAACNTVYPIRENIPILLVEEAIPREKWQKEAECACS